MLSREPLSRKATDHGVIAKECTNEGRALLLDLDMKYIDADLLRKEIERRITDNTFGAKLELIDILAWIDTLSEEPDKSLEEAAYKYSFDSRPSIYGQADVIDAFKAGAEWQASQMPMPEDTVLFNKGVAEGRRLEREDMLKDAMEGEAEELYNDGESQCVVGVGTYFKPGDKVYVLKAEEE